MEKKLSFLGIDRSPPLSPSVSSARNPAAKRNDGAAGWPRCCLVIWETWSGLVIGECGSVAEGSSASRRRRKRSVTAGRRGGVTKGRGCSPVVRSPFSASIFLLSFLVTRSVVHVVIQLSYRRIWKTNFSKNLSNLDDDLTIFPRRTISISISITHQRNLPIAKNEKRRKTFPPKIKLRKKIGTQLDPSLPPLVLVIDREKRKWKKNGW